MVAWMLKHLSLRKQMYLVGALPLAGIAAMVGLSLAADSVAGSASRNALVTIAAGTAVLSFALAHFAGLAAGRRAERIVRALQDMSRGDLRHGVKLEGKDEFSWMAWEFSSASKAFSRIVAGVRDDAGRLAAAAEQLSVATGQAKCGIDRQNEETGQVAAALNQMSASVQAVAGSASRAAEAAEAARRSGAEGNQVVEATIANIDGLSREMEQAARVIARLKEDTVAVGTVLSVIREVADQTNLLALNAAIEAARAGEHGRGFAVVADEVRTLASRTRESTQEIRAIIERLQVGANDAVLAMDQGQGRARNTVAEAAKAAESLALIARTVDTIKDMNAQIAGAVEQQSTAAAEICGSVDSIAEIAGDTSRGAELMAQSSGDLAQMAEALDQVARQFRLP